MREKVLKRFEVNDIYDQKNSTHNINIIQLSAWINNYQMNEIILSSILLLNKKIQKQI